MPKIELTQDEITLLFETLDDWERVPGKDAFSNMLIASITTQDQGKEARKQAIDKTAQDARQQELGRKRRSIILKAKLIQVSEQATTNDLFSAAHTIAKPE